MRCKVIALQILAVTLWLTTSVQSSEAKDTTVNVTTLEQFMAAFNAHNSRAMAKLVTEDIEWLSIDGNKVATEARGKSDLIKSMDAYFKSCPSCRSKLTNLTSTKNRVSAIEIASWQSENDLNSQKAFCVYEFSNGVISRVYYFPVEE